MRSVGSSAIKSLITLQVFSPRRKEGVKISTSDEIWPKNMFILYVAVIPHLTSQFCSVKLVPQILRKNILAT